MKRMFAVFSVVLGLMLTWNTVIADDLFVVPVKGQFTSWDKKIPSSTRFKLVLDGEAVLDRETGLVWEKSLCTTYKPSAECNVDWINACLDCYNKEVGGRKGWRLPTAEELASLIDPTQSNPALPENHPFKYVVSNTYWTSTTAPGGSYFAMCTRLSDGLVSYTFKTYGNLVWCVRGGYGHDAY